MILNVLISTINDRILGLEHIITQEKDIVYTVSHQVTKKLDKKIFSYICKLKEKENIIYSQISSIGVAKNRNNALNYRVKGSICLLCDDDIIYYKDSFQKIRDEFKKDKNLEFLTFKIKTYSGKNYKNYKSYSFKHTLKSLSIIGIVDVAFREEVIDKYHLSFDERFGPGGYYPIGEDFIFMTDAVKQKAKIIYKPINIVQHDESGTGMMLKDDIIIGRGAMFARVFGILSFFVDIYFAIKNYKKYNCYYGFIEYCRLLCQGSLHYIKKGNY